VDSDVAVVNSNREDGIPCGLLRGRAWLLWAKPGVSMMIVLQAFALEAGEDALRAIGGPEHQRLMASLLTGMLTASLLAADFGRRVRMVCGC